MTIQVINLREVPEFESVDFFDETDECCKEQATEILDFLLGNIHFKVYDYLYQMMQEYE